MTEKHYKQIFIKSEADFPKETGWYFVGTFLNGQIETTYYVQFNPEIDSDKTDWVAFYDWYLQEVPASNDKVIIEKQDELIKHFWDYYIAVNSGFYDKSRLQIKKITLKLTKELNQLKGKR